MKNMMLVGILMLGLNLVAHAQDAVELKGKDSQGQACSLVIESWSFDGAEVFSNLVVRARTSWQRAANPTLEARQSATPGTLYGINKDTKDQIAITFGDGDLNPQAIQSLIFESHAPRLQEYCRFQ